MGRGAGGRPSGRLRGGDRSGGAAAAAAHHDRAGQGARPRRCSPATRTPARSSGSRSSRRSRSSSPADEHCAVARADGPGASELEVAAYTIPTDAPEADGTLAWDSTTIVVVHAHAGGECGLGYTYADVSTAKLIESKLADVVRGADAMSPEAAWEAMVGSIRNLGRPGIASMAISAVDVALWDLKARLLGLPLCSLLGAVRDAGRRSTARGGFTAYSLDAAAGAARGLGRARDPAGQDEGRQRPRRGPRPGARPRAQAIGPDARAVRRRQRRLLAQAGARARRALPR